MYRLARISKVWYALKITAINEEEIDNLVTLVADGTPVLYVDDLDDARKAVQGEIITVEPERRLT